MNTLGDGPIDENYKANMVAIVEALDDTFNHGKKAPDKDVGFVLLVFPYHDHGGRCNFMSNGADRKDLVVLFKEMIARFEGMPTATGNG